MFNSQRMGAHRGTSPSAHRRGQSYCSLTWSDIQSFVLTYTLPPHHPLGKWRETHFKRKIRMHQKLGVKSRNLEPILLKRAKGTREVEQLLITSSIYRVLRVCQHCAKNVPYTHIFLIHSSQQLCKDRLHYYSHVTKETKP